jgi:hypothetical protein
MALLAGGASMVLLVTMAVSADVVLVVASPTN